MGKRKKRSAKHRATHWSVDPEAQKLVMRQQNPLRHIIGVAVMVKGIDHKQLAKDSGLSQRHIKDTILGRRYISTETLAYLLVACDIMNDEGKFILSSLVDLDLLEIDD